MQRLARFLFSARIRTLGAGVGLLLLCSCASGPGRATGELTHPQLPPEVSINRGAGRDDWLFVTLRLEDGEKQLFIVDTGAPFTLLDRSLEPRLGKRLGRKKVHSFYGVMHGNVFAAPKLFLGDTALVTGRRVVTVDLGRDIPYPSRPLMGILGMDCLKHYCLQLDFASEKLRFLDPNRMAPAELGKAYLLGHPWFTACITAHITPAGIEGAKSLIDTGAIGDGSLKPGLLRRELREHKAVLTNDVAWFPKADVGGVRYTNLFLDKAKRYSIWFGQNLTGLQFLARHLVTFDFPRGVMYLRPESVGSLNDDADATNAPGPTVAWWSAADSPAPTNAASLADRILSAPNLYPGDAVPELVWGVFLHPIFRPLRIPVGSPPARLSALQLPPADYHERVIAKTGQHAGKTNLTVSLVSQGKGPPTPLASRGTVVLLHGYNSQKEFMSFWAYLLAQAGYRAVLVDLRGHGQSTGQAFTYGRDETADLSQVLDFLTQRQLCAGTVGVLGVGFGADVALQWAARDARVSAVVAIAPHDEPEPAFARIVKATHAPISPALLRGALALVARRLNLRWADLSSAAAVRQLGRPVLFVAGNEDAISPVKEVKSLEQAAPTGSRILVVPGANTMAVGNSFANLSAPVKAWFREHLDAPGAGGLAAVNHGQMQNP